MYLENTERIKMTVIKEYFDIKLREVIHVCAKLVSSGNKSLAFVWTIYDQDSGRIFARRELHVDGHNGYLSLFFDESESFIIRFDDIESSVYRREDQAYIEIKSPTITAEIALNGLSVGYF